MKIVFCSNMNGGGAERVISVLAGELVNEGAEVYIIACLNGFLQYDIDSRIKFIHIEGTKYNGVKGVLFRLHEYRRTIKEIGADYVISLGEMDLAAMYAGKTTGSKVILSERSDPKRKRLERWYNQILKRFFFCCADKVVFQTQYAKECYSGIIQKHGEVIPNPLMPDLPEPYVGQRKKEIVSAGRLIRLKNYPMLIEAFAKFTQECPEYSLSIYGEGVVRRELEQMIAEKGLTEKVKLCGYDKHVTEKIRCSEIYVSTSNYEGMPNAVAEAMGMGLSVIATDCPSFGVRMLIENKKNGLLIPVGDVDALYNAMRNLASDETLRNLIGRCACDIRSELNVKKIVSIWNEKVFFQKS